MRQRLNWFTLILVWFSIIQNSSTSHAHKNLFSLFIIGIAFEQGKCLPTPETIPFRLTRDLVSALGCTGVDGVFRKSCEKTMEVLRENKTTIVTILEVLLHDPLYTWSLSNKKAHREQSANNVARNFGKNIINQLNV